MCVFAKKAVCGSAHKLRGISLGHYLDSCSIAPARAQTMTTSRGRLQYVQEALHQSCVPGEEHWIKPCVCCKKLNVHGGRLCDFHTNVAWGCVCVFILHMVRTGHYRSGNAQPPIRVKIAVAASRPCDVSNMLTHRPPRNPLQAEAWAISTMPKPIQMAARKYLKDNPVAYYAYIRDQLTPKYEARM